MRRAERRQITTQTEHRLGCWEIHSFEVVLAATSIEVAYSIGLKQPGCASKVIVEKQSESGTITGMVIQYHRFRVKTRGLRGEWFISERHLILLTWR